MSKHKLQAERRARFIGYIQQGLTAEAIGQREGMVREAASKLRTVIAREEGLTVQKGQSEKPIPVGFNSEGNNLRHGLKHYAMDFVDNGKLTKKEALILLGLTNAEYSRAIQGGKREPTHDWTLSQMQRVASNLKIPFDQFMRLALEGPPQLWKIK